MTQFKTTHASPISTSELLNWLHRRGATIVRQNGTTHINIELGNGKKVGVVATQKHVSNVVLRDIASAMNMSFPDLRKAMGKPIQVRRKGKFKPEPKRTMRHTKNDVRRLLDRIHDEADILAMEIETDRDGSVYERLCQALSGAVTSMRGFHYEEDLIRGHTQVS